MKEIKGVCPICDAQIPLQTGTEESEILVCKECQSRLVVAKLRPNFATLEQAPAVEEDWGQ